MQPSTVRRIAILGNHLPRRCGIASFTADLAKSVADASPEACVDVIAMNDGSEYAYPRPVIASIDADDRAAYAAMAGWLNDEKYDVLNVQHEFGIYGGECGVYLLDLLRNVKMPIVSTLHTILQEPSEAQRSTLEEILQLSERIVVMTAKGAEILHETYGVPKQRVDVIPHGIHDVDPDLGMRLRASMELTDRPLILTFGLLSPDKGIHDMILGMSSVVNRHPDAAYVILGATHPHIREREGEKYREYLARLCKDLGIERNVYLVNRFVSNRELAGWLATADVYVTPYLKAQQITSGTLAYAVGAGKPVVSTPFWHAEELLDDERGILVPFNSSSGLAEAVNNLLSNPRLRREVGTRAFEYGRSMRWPKVGEDYLRTFHASKAEGLSRLRQIADVSLPGKSLARLPTFSLAHAAFLTDSTGMIQHAIHRFQNREEGYCADDNSRALQVCVLAERLGQQGPVRRLRDTYFNFMLHAFDRQTSKFRNFMGYDRQWIDIGSDDCQGRAFLALAAAFAARTDSEISAVSRDLLLTTLPTTAHLSSPRSWASIAIGCARFLTAEEVPEIRHTLRRSAQRILTLHRATQQRGWNWCEDRLTYENALLPRSLIVAGEALRDGEMLEVGLSSLHWLCEQQTAPTGVFAPIGSDGFYVRGYERAWFDQQPLEAAATVSACLDAWRASGGREWIREAERAFCWFLGDNTEGISLIQPETGRCFDALHRGRANQNSGAESTLAYLSARLEIEEVKAIVTDQPVNVAEG